MIPSRDLDMSIARHLGWQIKYFPGHTHNGIPPGRCADGCKTGQRGGSHKEHHMKYIPEWTRNMAMKYSFELNYNPKFKAKYGWHCKVGRWSARGYGCHEAFLKVVSKMPKNFFKKPSLKKQ